MKNEKTVAIYPELRLFWILNRQSAKRICRLTRNLDYGRHFSSTSGSTDSIISSLRRAEFSLQSACLSLLGGWRFAFSAILAGVSHSPDSGRCNCLDSAYLFAGARLQAAAFGIFTLVRAMVPKGSRAKVAYCSVEGLSASHFELHSAA